MTTSTHLHYNYNLTVKHSPYGVFGDEFRYLLHRVDGPVRAERLQGEALHEDCIQYTLTGGGGSRHDWGTFPAGGRTQLVTLGRNTTGAVYLNILT